MAKLRLRGKDLRKIRFPNGPAKSLALTIVAKHFRHLKKQEAIDLLVDLLADPTKYAEQEHLKQIVDALQKRKGSDKAEIALRPNVEPYKVYGIKNIEEGAHQQMETAMRLPVAVSGALMADAHHGYGLPIGGVLATENAVIPYGVGVDIGCRMCLSIFDLPAQKLVEERSYFRQLLEDNARFGYNSFDDPMDDPVLARKEFKEIPIVRSLKDRAYKQIGSSGSGNHFVEFGIVNIEDPENEWKLPTGEYLGLLSHSGSRGLGANIARHYTKVAMEQCLLPKEAKHLAWLSLDSEEGMEYWLAMNLAGDYASACHHHIHRRMSHSLGLPPLTMVENHHNFAWKELQADGRELIVHRKGATPAQKGVLGIIPGSMTAPGYIVRGKGDPESLSSASHGAGRRMSRTKARQNIHAKELKRFLQDQGVTLIGGGLDEAPMAYKDIREVMAAQSALVDVVGTFLPRIVRMDKA
ncbi:MAG: RtcB family protein [Bacteroidota bacterium]